MKWDFVYRGESRLLDDEARSAAGGSFVSLPQGQTHYQIAGPGAAQPVVVLVHGFSVPYFIWDATFEALRAARHRVLRYDLYGRGYSDRPHVRYGMDLFVKQLANLLDALHQELIDLVGLSMGGLVATTFTAKYPHRVRRLVLIDPIGTQPMPLSLFYRAALLPGVSELMLSLIGNERMVEGLASDFFDPTEVQRFRDRYRVQMQFRGFKRAIVSTLRNKAVEGSPEAYARLGQLDTPVLLIWGRGDRTLPLEHSRSILKLVPRAQLHVIENAGHIPHVEQPGIVHPILLAFLGAL